MALNRAIAIAEIEGPRAALDLIDQAAPNLANYHLMHAARGTYLRRLGQRDAAASAFQGARDLAGTDPERGFLADQVKELTSGSQDESG